MDRAMAKAERAAKAVEEKAALALKNRRRAQETSNAARNRARLKKSYEEKKEMHAQLGVAINEMLRQFCQELQGLLLVKVDQLFDRDAVERRKSQMSILKETMATVTMLQKMQESLEDKYNIKKEDAKENNGDNVLLFKNAQKLMAKASK
ncbi:hypothetical protein CY658_21635 [Variovorax sp. RO1]|nr:hypothetical protein CY658_21635 [Variovorax sp. RO1]